MEVKVIYEESGENGMLTPVWMIVDHRQFNWDKTLFIDISAPFQRATYDDINDDLVAVTIPDYAYTRDKANDQLVGISLPVVQRSGEHDLSAMNRLILRIGDVEDTLQYSLRNLLKW